MNETEKLVEELREGADFIRRNIPSRPIVNDTLSPTDVRHIDNAALQLEAAAEALLTSTARAEAAEAERDSAVASFQFELEHRLAAEAQVSTLQVEVEGLRKANSPEIPDSSSCTISTDAPAFGAAEVAQRKSDEEAVNRVRAALERATEMINDGLKGRTHDVWQRAWNAGAKDVRNMVSAALALSAHPPSGAATVKPCQSEEGVCDRDECWHTGKCQGLCQSEGGAS